MGFQIIDLLLPLVDSPDPNVINNRPGVAITPRHIVVHRTGNPESTARGNRNWFARNEVWGSAHYNVDSKEIIRCIPEKERAYHVSVKNRKTDGLYVDVARWSIGIEFCEPYSSDAYERYIWLCADICYRYNLNPDKDITPHSYWDPTDRPYDPVSTKSYADKTYDATTKITLVRGTQGPADLFDWTKFIGDVKWLLKAMRTPTPPPKEYMFSDISDHWARDSIEFMAKLKVVEGFEGKFSPEMPLKRGEAAALLKRLYEVLKK